MASRQRPRTAATINTGGRASCLVGKHKKFKAMLDQQHKTVDVKLTEKKEREKTLKTEMKKAASDLQTEHGMVDESQTRAAAADSRRQHKIFLDSLFPPPINNVIHNGKRLFRTKQSMQLYFQRVIDADEWTENIRCTAAIKETYS